MRSDFKLFISAAVVGAGCYVLASANGNTILILMMVASVTWCLWSWQLDRRRALTAGGSAASLHAELPRVKEQVAEPRQSAPASEPKVVAPQIRRFPISKLAEG